MNENLIPLLLSIGIVAGTLLVAFLFRRLFNRFIKKATRIVKNDPTNYLFLKHTVSALIYIVGFSWAFIQIESLKAVASSLLAGAGILAVAVGFASQQALSNIVGGIFIVIFKPYRINDRVVLKDSSNGIVEDITLRHTVIRDYENRRIVVPNSIISNEVLVNIDLIDERVCRHVEIGISYDSDIQKARKIMREEVLNHPEHIDHRSPEQIKAGEEEVVVRVVSMGDFSVNLKAWAWARNQVKGYPMHCDLLESIKIRFDREGIEIPFPYRTIVNKKDLEEIEQKV